MTRPPDSPPVPSGPARDLASWLADCLPPRLAGLVTAAYRLADPAPDFDRHRASLRDLAKPLGLSRERARQLLDRALAWLRLPAARAAAAPLYAAAEDALRRAGGNLDPAETDALADDPVWHGVSPVGAFRLLGDVSPDAPPRAFRGFFTLHPLPAVRAAAEAFDALLLRPCGDGDPLLPPDRWAARLPAIPGIAPADLPALVRALARHAPGALLAKDGLCGPASPGVEFLLRRILRERGECSVAALAKHYNALVAPGFRLGEGALRRHLCNAPGIRRTRVNHYAAAPSPASP